LCRRSTLSADSNESACELRRAVGLFKRYASGAVSIDELAAEHGMNDRTLNDILKNPIYNRMEEA
jgi:transcriptional regulator GlxA family with amidase domain